LNLNLGTYEGRLAASLAVGLALKERLQNIRNPVLLFPNGSRYNFVMGMPLSWEHFDQVPSSGFLSFRYVCAPEDRNSPLRFSMALKYGSWRINPAVDKVIYWSALSEAPDSVLTVLYYILQDFKDVWGCWKKLCGSGLSSVSISQFKISMKKFKWKKLSKHPEQVIEIFRFLDPDESGEVSSHEWCVLHQLWKELNLSILEFLQYLDRTFGSCFDTAWKNLDADDSGEIDREEWAEAVSAIGYFGEGTPIFNYACDANDNITIEGWNKLMDLWRNRVKLQALLFNQ